MLALKWHVCVTCRSYHGHLSVSLCEGPGSHWSQICAFHCAVCPTSKANLTSTDHLHTVINLVSRLTSSKRGLAKEDLVHKFTLDPGIRCLHRAATRKESILRASEQILVINDLGIDNGRSR